MADVTGVALGRADAARFVWNDVELRRVFAGPTGPIARDLARRAIKIQNQAKRNASGRPGPRVQTGRLRASINWRIRDHGYAIVADIGTNVSYAYYLEVTGVGVAGKRYPFLGPALEAMRGASLH